MWVVKIMVHGHTATEVLQTLHTEVIGLLECYKSLVEDIMFASPQLGDRLIWLKLAACTINHGINYSTTGCCVGREIGSLVYIHTVCICTVLGFL